jgi:CHASE2 domain-containing sensor protein
MRMNRTTSDDSPTGTAHPPRRPVMFDWSVFGDFATLKLIFLQSVFAVAMMNLDWTGLPNYTEQVIDRYVARATQLFYPGQERDKLAILQIDQETLDYLRHDWPLPLSDIADMAERLACNGAAAIFFDFTASRQFTDGIDDDRIKALVGVTTPSDLLCPDGKPMPRPKVFFANIPGVDSLLQKEILKTGTFLVQFDVGNENNIYPSGMAEFPESPPESNDRTPAFGLLHALCQSSSSSWCPDTSGLNSLGPIFLSWNGNPVSHQTDVSSSSICNTKPIKGWFTQIYERLRMTVELVFHPPRYRCAPFLSLVGSDLYRDFAYKNENGDPARFIGGRVVMVGVKLAGINDIWDSPVHGQLPGVYAHAMALDNLLTYGDRHFTKPPRFWKSVVSFVYFLGANTLLTLLSRRAGSRTDENAMHLAPTVSELLKILTLIMAWIVPFCLIAWTWRWPTSFVVLLLPYLIGSDILWGGPIRAFMREHFKSERTQP